MKSGNKQSSASNAGLQSVSWGEKVVAILLRKKNSLKSNKELCIIVMGTALYPRKL